jgi:hypothetical protein
VAQLAGLIGGSVNIGGAFSARLDLRGVNRVWDV